MSNGLSQDVVNQICQKLSSLREEITVEKVYKSLKKDLPNLSVVELAEKVLFFKENPTEAINHSEVDTASDTTDRDEIIELLDDITGNISIDRSNQMLLKDAISEYIQKKVSNDISIYKTKYTYLSNKNDSLEILNISLKKQVDDLLAKNNTLKEENYNLKQQKNYKYDLNANNDANQLSKDEFKPYTYQLGMLKDKSKVAVFDESKGHILIKFPATDYFTQECRKQDNNRFQAKVEYDYSTKTWRLSHFYSINKTLSLLKRNRFIFSQELETVAQSYLK